MAHFHEAIAIDPAFADAYSNLGCALRDQGRPGDAAKCFVAAIQLQPNFAHAFANLGACYKATRGAWSHCLHPFDTHAFSFFSSAPPF